MSTYLMYSKLPHLVFGFHGCDRQLADDVIAGRADLLPSMNDYDWLGSGIYFWEQNYARAYDWAAELQKSGKIGEPGVVGAVIDLGYCLNLTDSRYIDLLKDEYLALKEEHELLGSPMPSNVGKTEDKLLRRLDCAVIEHLHAWMHELVLEGQPGAEEFDSVRGLFSEGRPIYPGAGFKAKTHVQICVRNPNCIKGYFAPREKVDEWPNP